VVTVYDMIHERFPQMFAEKGRTAAQKLELVNRAAHVICISDATRRDLIDILGTPASKISVIHLGAPAGANLPRKPLARLSENYLLYVGTRWPYKNFPFLLEAVRPLLLGGDRLRLVCVGRPFDEQETELLRRHGLLARVEANQALEDQLADLYRGAVCHIIPSLYEGFGLTLLEAFSYDCPVACSNSGSLPEVAGDAASYFDPTDVRDARRAIQRIVEDSKFAAGLRLAGRRRAQQFSWLATAQATLEVYRRVARS
jgi:glycosyltransferase involved in cell wall biosynthesis